MYHKSITMSLGLLIAAILLSGCGKADDKVNDITTETDTIISSVSTETSVPKIEIGVSGEILSFPFKYEELEKLLDLSDCQNVYFEEKDSQYAMSIRGWIRSALFSLPEMSLSIHPMPL